MKVINPPVFPAVGDHFRGSGMDPICQFQPNNGQAKLPTSRIRLSGLVLLAGLIAGLAGCGVNEYLEASKQTWATLKQFDENEKKLGGPAEIPVLERQTGKSSIKGPLLELCFRPPVGFKLLNQQPIPVLQSNMLQYAAADGKPSGGIYMTWLIIRPGKDIDGFRKELAQSPLFSLGEGSWDKTSLKSPGVRGSLALEWFKPSNKPAQPAASPPVLPSPAVTTPSNAKTKDKSAPKASQPKTPPTAPTPAMPNAMAFIFPYESLQEPSLLALVFQPAPGMEVPARDLAMRSVATARTLAQSGQERARLSRKKTSPGSGAPAGAPGSPAVGATDQGAKP